MHPDLEAVLLNENDILERVEELAAEVEDVCVTPPVVLVVVNGAMIFASDFVRAMKRAIRLDTIRVASYGVSGESNRKPKILSDVRLDLADQDVLIIDDIVDTGRTLKKMTEVFAAERPRSVRACVLLDKPARREVDYRPDFRGFEIEDKFVVGYGLDYAERYRNLPYLGVLRS